MNRTSPYNDLLEKIRRLPPDKAAKIEEFIDFLSRREEHRRLVRAAADLSGDAFHQVWDNPDDSIYDQI